MTNSQQNYDLFDDSVDVASSRIDEAIEALAREGGVEARGAVFTKVEVVNFILDLVGYTEDKPLHQKKLLEPSFGGGDFLLPAIGRLLAAWRVFGSSGNIVNELSGAIRAVELHYETFITTREAVLELLVSNGIAISSATILVEHWLVRGDFLIESLGTHFDFVVGNPPYVRQELIPAPLLAEYRRRYQTLYDRADLFIPFIERSLLLLAEGGSLCFICSDRWMKNRYGGPLRNFVDKHFHLKVYVDMVDTPAFHNEVTAYPAITVISREKQGPTRIAHRPSIDRATLIALARDLCATHLLKDNQSVQERAGVTNKSEPWLLGSFDQMKLIRRIESQLPTLEEADCKVGIGVATGADKAFIGNLDLLDVEPDRKLPLVTTGDIETGQVRWKGQGVINPFTEDGNLVNLQEYPRLHQYLNERQEVIKNRRCAKDNPLRWYRTIDRITPSLLRKPKLLIPDIKGKAHVVYEKGELYPHHNLYYVTSEMWDLHALQAVLLSSIALLFVTTYSTEMRGGYIRFQAQYLRRIRIPYWNSVQADLRLELILAAKNLDLEACNQAAFKLFGLTQEEQALLGGNGE